MTNQPIYISLEQVLDFFQTIVKFISDNTPALNFLLGRGGILIVIVGFISARNNNQPLGLDTFRDTLKGTWEKRYQEVVKKYPIAPYIYDAVELLQMVAIEIYPFTVKPTALLIADRNLLRRVWLWWQIPTTLRYYSVFDGIRGDNRFQALIQGDTD